MIELLSAYSFSEILAIIVALAFAIKGTISFWDWAKERLRRMFNKETQYETEQQKIENLTENQKQLMEAIEKLTTKVDMLIDSDKDDIKAYITEKHHCYVYGQKWIDDYTLDCITRRFQHYKSEGGNSFIETLMKELENLPKQPPSA